MSQEPPLNIPTVDLLELDGADPARRAAAAHAIRVGFGHFGLVYVKNHGLQPAELNAFYDAFLGLTRQPDEAKRKLARPDVWYQRGWTPPHTEHAVIAGGQADFKECYFAAPMPLDPDCALQYPEIYAENIWPEDGGAMRTSYASVGGKLHDVGRALLRGCAEALDLPTHLLESATHGGPHVLRALRYLPLTADQVGRGVLWGEEHTDFNLVTLLPGGRFLDPNGDACAPPDAESGLYLRTRATPDAPSGRLVRGNAPPGCIVAQVGQQLEILTGGTFLATPHVITAPRVPGYSRLSSAYFVHLHPQQILFPLRPFRNPETVRAYSPPVLAGTYDLKTLVDIQLAPRAALDALGYRHYDRLARQRAVEPGS